MSGSGNVAIVFADRTLLRHRELAPKVTPRRSWSHELGNGGSGVPQGVPDSSHACQAESQLGVVHESHGGEVTPIQSVPLLHLLSERRPEVENGSIMGSQLPSSVSQYRPEPKQSRQENKGIASVSSSTGRLLSWNTFVAVAETTVKPGRQSTYVHVAP